MIQGPGFELMAPCGLNEKRLFRLYLVWVLSHQCDIAAPARSTSVTNVEFNGQLMRTLETVGSTPQIRGVQLQGTPCIGHVTG